MKDCAELLKNLQTHFHFGKSSQGSICRNLSYSACSFGKGYQRP